jgi:hypothetical protein
MVQSYGYNFLPHGRTIVRKNNKTTTSKYITKLYSIETHQALIPKRNDPTPTHPRRVSMPHLQYTLHYLSDRKIMACDSSMCLVFSCNLPGIYNKHTRPIPKNVTIWLKGWQGQKDSINNPTNIFGLSSFKKWLFTSSRTSKNFFPKP